MERVYGVNNPGASLNFDLPNHIEHGEEEEEASEDERIKERELQDLLTNAFDDLDEEDDENCSLFLGEGSIHSSRSSRNSAGRSAQQANASDMHLNARITPINKEQTSTQESRTDSVNDINWEDRYYIDQWVETEHQSGISDQQDKSIGDEFQQPRGNLLDNVAYSTDKRVPVEYRSHTQHGTGTQTEGAGGDSSEQIRIKHLEVLYAARGREIHKLQHDLQVLKDDWATENAALRQQLRETEEERADYALGLEECQKALDVANDAGAKLEGELRAVNMKCEAIDENRNEILAKLQVAEAAIEGLHCQVNELQKCENLGRSRENHAAIVYNLQEKHRNEAYQLNEEIGDLRERLLEREEEIKNLRAKMERVTRECEDVKVEKGETVNRLITALEASQEKCKKLVNSAGESAVKSNDQIQSLESLKEELAVANQELNMYRSASRLGIGTRKNDDSSGIVISDNLISSLKAEVERSLASLSAKNDQLKKVQAEFQTSITQIKILRGQKETAENAWQISQEKIKELSNELSFLKSSAEASSSISAKELNHLKNEKKCLESELQESKSQVGELVASKKQLNELVSKLREEMKKLDKEKLIAVEECRESCLKLQSDSIQLERHRFAQNLKEAQKQNEERARKLMNELEEVKALYVKVCQEKDGLEESLRNEWEIEKKRLKESWTEDKELEIIMLKGDMEKQQQRGETNLKSEFVASEVAIEVSKQMAERIKHAKRIWEKEQMIKMEENALIKAKEMLQDYINGKTFDNSEAVIDDYVEQIKELEKRVRETEELFRKHLTELESNKEKQKARELKELEERLKLEHETILRDAIIALKLKFEKEELSLKAKLSDRVNEETLKKLLHSSEERLKAVTEKQREELLKEFNERAEADKRKLVIEIKLEAEKAHQLKMESLIEEKELEKMQALTEQEERLCKELEDFLSAQKQRFLTALQTMQDSHVKEKGEIQANYDGIISRLKSECKEHQENRQLDQQRLNNDNLNQYEEERKVLCRQIEELKAKCTLIGNEKLSLSTKAQLELKSTKTELEECRLKLEQNEADWMTKQEQLVIVPLRQDLATMRARANASEEVAAQLRLQLEAGTIEMKKLNDKYTILKEKVKKYHRYVHGKEREFTENLTKMTSEHRNALERISMVKGEVAEVVENRLGDLYNLCVLTKDNSSATSNKRPQTPDKILNNKSFFPKPLKGDKLEKEEAKTAFISTIENLHGDVIKFLNDCSREAVERIQEEVAKASWVLSEQLRGLSNQVNVPSTTSKQTSLYEGSHSGTVTPEPPTNGSSGRGTMVGNSAGSASEGAAEPCRTNNSAQVTKPLKFWSSTPFQPSNTRFGEVSKTPVTVVESSGLKYSEDTDVWPVSYKANSQKTPVVHEEELENDEARMAKLRMLTEQILIRSRSTSVTNENLVEDEAKQSSKKNQFLTFASDLSTLKNEFWKTINGNNNA